MKSFMSFTLAILLAISPLAGFAQAPKEVKGSGLKRAIELYVPIACTGPTFFRWKIGTGFPVAKDIVMSAGHVQCEEGEVTEISVDGGYSWRVVSVDNIFRHTILDLQLIKLDGYKFEDPAEFRPAVVGELVSGFGVAFNEVATKGFVMQIKDGFTLSSNPVIGGMSGSALVGEDGKVVGVVVEAWPATVGPGFVSVWLTAAIDAKVAQAELKAFLEGLQP